MSISSEITRISGNVSDALTAIGAKGVTVPSGSNSDDLADLIAQISGGGDSGYTLTTIVPQQTITPASSDGTYKADLSYLVNLEEGADYIVTINGAEYWTTCVLMWGTNYLLGDINHFWSSDEQPYPFGIINENNAMTIATSSGSARTVKVEKIELTGSGGGGGSGSATLTTKTITLNGSYSAQTDNADGYSAVTVNVQNGASMTEVQNTYGTELVITSAQSAAPSATRHTLYFEYEDESTEMEYAYYDDAFIGTAITATTPTTRDNKTVTSAQLDGVEWYSYTPTPSGNWTTIYDGSITVSNREFSLTSITDTFTLNDVWRVTLDGTAYTFTVQHADSYDTNYIGNIAIVADWASSGDPIVCYNIAGYIMGNTYLADGSHTLKLERQVSS